MAEPFRRLTEVDEVLVTGKGAKGLIRKCLWSRCKGGCVSGAVPVESMAICDAGDGERRETKVLHGYPVGKIRALGFIGERVPAMRGLHDVVQNLRLLKHLGAEP